MDATIIRNCVAKGQIVIPNNPFRKGQPEQSETCTMCGDFCAMKKGLEVFNPDITGDKIS
jgi:thiamine biosynthesis protein ThiC